MQEEVFLKAKNYIEKVGTKKLKPNVAILYSQQSRLTAGQKGLSYWKEGDEKEYLEIAIKLIESSLQIWEDDQLRAKEGLRRAGELLEWVSKPESFEKPFSVELFSAACYQLAGFPARAMGLLEEGDEYLGSKIIEPFLKNDFFQLQNTLHNFWNKQGIDNSTFPKVILETIRTMGILSADLRWGSEYRKPYLEEKFSRITRTLNLTSDTYSWLLARLISKIAKRYINSSMWSLLSDVFHIDDEKYGVYEPYLRSCFKENRMVAWPSQKQGLKKMQEKKKITVCTPTGSGKTTLAEIGFIDNLLKPIWGKNANSEEEFPICLYLVPKRALATEAEARFSNLVSLYGSDDIGVTSLYGGTDWGPSDAWVNHDKPMIMICTYEKAEALIRFLGENFIDRLNMLVFDEAHYINLPSNSSSFRFGENRQLKLESLSARLFEYLDEKDISVIGLSAVAKNQKGNIAKWIANDQAAEPVSIDYQSTRQLIGCLDCNKLQTIFRYHVLDGEFIKFEDEEDNYPYVPKPYPNRPKVPNLDEDKPEKKLRPNVFWVAMHMAKKGENVLISINQGIQNFEKDLLELIEGPWEDDLPEFFKPPEEGDDNYDLWQKGISKCKDYLGENSFEYRLLRRGVVVHHGKMPDLVSKTLLNIYRQGLCNIILATSTLTEGVNLPINTIIIPTLRRKKSSIPVDEFRNLAGRAGRPGSGTEGRVLVATERYQDYLKGTFKDNQSNDRYENMLIEFVEETSGGEKSQGSLGALMTSIYDVWQTISGSENPEEFIRWLESVVPGELQNEELSQNLDTLDEVLLSSIAEIEKLSEEEISRVELEEKLRSLWQKTYTYYATEVEESLEEIFAKRGIAIHENVYPDKEFRDEIYSTSLSPVLGEQLLDIIPEIRDHLLTGENYCEWDYEKRFSYLLKAINLFSEVDIFELSDGLDYNCEEILRWWLQSENESLDIPSKKLPKLHNYVNNNFNYKFNWAVGCFISYEFNNEFTSDRDSLPSWKDWGELDLPWVVFWIKELITWGTLEPVVAHLLARNISTTREEALEQAEDYYNQPEIEHKEDPLEFNLIAEWADELKTQENFTSDSIPSSVNAEKVKDLSGISQNRFHVFPDIDTDKINWRDPAGYVLAYTYTEVESLKNRLNQLSIDNNDFIFDKKEETVEIKPYLRSNQ